MFKKLFIPFEGNSENKYIRIASYILVPLITWTILPDNIFPPIHDILLSYPKLFNQNDLFGNFYTSIVFCLKSITYAAFIAFIFMCISRIPIFNAFCLFAKKFRFLPSVGLSFLFVKIGIDDVPLSVMVFGISTFLIDAGINIALSISKDEVDYAKSLRLSRWKLFREVVIFNKAPYFFSAVIQNFAIAWMLLASVENITKSTGGIGVLLAESSKYFKLEELYAIQILILLTGTLLDYMLTKIHESFFPYIKLKKI